MRNERKIAPQRENIRVGSIVGFKNDRNPFHPPDVVDGQLRTLDIKVEDDDLGFTVSRASITTLALYEAHEIQNAAAKSIRQIACAWDRE